MPESKTSTDAGTEGNPPSPYADRGERPSRLNPILLLWGAVVLTCVLVLLPILHSYNLYDVSRETWGRDVEIEKLRGTIVRLDEALAMSACMAAATGEDERWQRRYRDLEAQLDIAVKDVARLAPDRGDIAETSLPLAFNRKARETEKRALALVRQGRGKDALEILATTAYETERGITFQYEIPRTAQSRRRALRLQELCGAIMHLDEVLTMSARIAAATGDNRWEIRYRTAEPQLHAAIKGAARLMPDVLGVEAAEKTDEANRKLVKLENRAFALIREGRQEEAESLLCSNEYETQKEIYAEGTAEFADLISVGVSRFVAQAQRSVIEHIVEAIFVVILILVIWSFMLAMLNKWQKAMKEKNTQLAQRGQDLEDLNESLDSKVHERTWALKESQSATLNMLADVELTREGLVRANKTLRLEISSREEAQKALQEEKLFADSIIQTAQTIVLVLNTEGRIVRFNAYMENLSGYRLDEVKGKDWFETFLPKRDRARIRVLFMNAINDIQTTGKANPIVTKAGSERTVEWYDKTLKDASGKLIGLLAVGQDITNRLRMEAELRQSQKLESIGTLASGVAHEINNPIMGIMNYAQLILDKLGPDSPVAEYAAEIGKETERVATIVKNLLSFARTDKQSYSPARMCDIVESTLSLTRGVMRHDQITLAVNVPEDLPKIKCRSQQIQQVIMNLLTNARDALNERYPGHDENKKAAITARPIEKDGRQWIRTTVEDHGSGIPEDLRERLFDPFFTTKPRDKGTGLGLSVSHGIVKDHGGELSVESDVGEFTRFHLDLPVDNGWEPE